MMCSDIDAISPVVADDGQDKKRKLGLTERELKIAQRILMELYCNYEASQPFRELVDREVNETHLLM